MATSGWTVRPEKFAKDIDKSINELIERISYKIYNGVVDRTPVYTGRLQNCWTMSVGSESWKTMDLGKLTPSSPLSRPNTPVIKSVNFEKVYICNGQPYAGYVEFGGPNNAPIGMVETTLASL
jgi:hypothetical protein